MNDSAMYAWAAPGLFAFCVSAEGERELVGERGFACAITSSPSPERLNGTPRSIYTTDSRHTYAARAGEPHQQHFLLHSVRSVRECGRLAFHSHWAIVQTSIRLVEVKLLQHPHTLHPIVKVFFAGRRQPLAAVLLQLFPAQASRNVTAGTPPTCSSTHTCGSSNTYRLDARLKPQDHKILTTQCYASVPCGLTFQKQNSSSGGRASRRPSSRAGAK